MLGLLDPCELPLAYAPSGFVVRAAVQAWEVDEARALRRAVFCFEQGLFGADDRDGVDSHAQVLVAMSMQGGMFDQVVGTVRLHLDADAGGTVWWGSRLAVHAAFRHHGKIGATLIRLAVSRAHALGCVRFLAHVQLQNVPLFEKLHWRVLGEQRLHGRPHALMQADLAHYPPCHDPVSGYVTRPSAGGLAS